MEDMKTSCGPHGHKHGIGKLVFGSFLLIWGIIWLGNDLGWWQYAFPFWPVALIVVALMMLIHGIKKAF